MIISLLVTASSLFAHWIMQVFNQSHLAGALSLTRHANADNLVLYARTVLCMYTHGTTLTPSLVPEPLICMNHEGNLLCEVQQVPL